MQKCEVGINSWDCFQTLTASKSSLRPRWPPFSALYQTYCINIRMKKSFCIWSLSVAPPHSTGIIFLCTADKLNKKKSKVKCVSVSWTLLDEHRSPVTFLHLLFRWCWRVRPDTSFKNVPKNLFRIVKALFSSSVLCTHTKYNLYYYSYLI